MLAIAYAVMLETRGEEDEAFREKDVPTAFYPEHEEHLLKIEREAIDLAYKQQLQQLFLVWMKDPTDQPRRAHRGTNIAKEAYVKSMDALNAREAKMKEMLQRPPDWKP